MGPKMTNTNNINVDEMREAIVGGNTYNGYKYDILKIIEDSYSNQHLEGWLTTGATESFKSLLDEIENDATRQQRLRKNEWVLQAVRNCREQPILNINNCTATAFMNWLQTVRDADGQFQSNKSAYGNRCAALHHLFRCHASMDGYPLAFEKGLKSLKKRIISYSYQ